MIRASDLIGCVVRTDSRQRLGRVHDLRARAVTGGWELVGLVVGRGGMVARMSGSDSEALVRGSVVPWQAVTGLSDGLVTVMDGTRG
jgi:hypothetical protein